MQVNIILFIICSLQYSQRHLYKTGKLGTDHRGFITLRKTSRSLIIIILVPTICSNLIIYINTMSNNSEAMKKRLEAINRKLQYKDLIDLGGRVSKLKFVLLFIK